MQGLEKRELPNVDNVRVAANHNGLERQPVHQDERMFLDDGNRPHGQIAQHFI